MQEHETELRAVARQDPAVRARESRQRAVARGKKTYPMACTCKNGESLFHQPCGCLLYNRQSQMQEQVNYLIAQQNQHHLEQFSCNASLGGSFTFDEDKKQDDHNNSGDDSSKVGNATKEILQISGGPQPHSDSNAAQSKPPAKSQSTPKISKYEDKTSRKPRKSKSHDEEKTKVSYYSTFQDRIRGEPAAAVNVGANAGLKNSNVSCYSNAILQCLASCIFSPISHQVLIIQNFH